MRGDRFSVGSRVVANRSFDRGVQEGWIGIILKENYGNEEGWNYTIKWDSGETTLHSVWLNLVEAPAPAWHAKKVLRLG